MTEKTAMRLLAVVLAVMAIGGVAVSGVAVAQETAGNDDDVDTQQSSYLRVIHASPGAPAVDIAIDNETVASGVEYGNVTDYLALESGNHTILITAAADAGDMADNESANDTAGESEVLFEGDVSLDQRTSSTLAATGAVTQTGEMDEDDAPVTDGNETDNATDNETATATEDMADNATETATEGMTDDGTETATAGAADDGTETATAGTTDDGTETATAGTTDDGTETEADGLTDDGTETATEGAADDATETATAGAADEGTETEADGLTDNGTETETDGMDDNETQGGAAEAPTDEQTQDDGQQLEPVLYVDNAWEPDDDEAAVSVIHLAQGADAVDVTVADGPMVNDSMADENATDNATDGAGADNQTVLVDDLEYTMASDYVTVPEGNYTLDIRQATETNDGDIITTVNVSVEGGNAYSALAMASANATDQADGEMDDNATTDTATDNETADNATDQSGETDSPLMVSAVQDVTYSVNLPGEATEDDTNDNETTADDNGIDENDTESVIGAVGL